MAESKFAASLVRMFNSNGCNATRIESHGTGNGIPDMYVLGFGTDFWLELKHDPKLGQNARTIKVDWRPGQQGWMYIYCLQHRQKRLCLTVIKASKGYYIVPMFQVFENDRVIHPIYVQKLHPKLLCILTYRPLCMPGWTYRDMLLTFMETWFPDVDYDPEVLWSKETIDTQGNIGLFTRAIPEILEDINYGQRVHAAKNSRQTESPGAVVQECCESKGS